jgi:superfamily II DNA or RNA helicase
VTFLTDGITRGTDWRAVERAFARLVLHLGWRDVRVIGQSGDAGGDVIGVVNEKGKSKIVVIQVRASTSGNYVGPEKIQQVLEALPKYSGNVAIVATNADFTASAYKRQKQLLSEGYDVRLWNGTFLQNIYSKVGDFSTAKRPLRSYQQELVDRCLTKFEGGSKTASFIVATGLGKSVIASELLSLLFNRGFKRALVLCHTRPLAMQLEQAFWSQISKKVPTRTFFAGMPPSMEEGVDFGLYQTLQGYLSGLSPDAYEVVIVDEAHHALASGFTRVIQHLCPKLLVGMTATPWRGDGLPMEMLFGQPVGAVSVVDGMKLGFLAHVDYRIFTDTIDWRLVAEKANSKKTRIRDLNKKLFIPQRDEAVIDSINKVAREVANPKVIVFCASIEHGKRFAALMNISSTLSCSELSGVERVEQNRRLMEFASGRINAVTAVDLLNEGIDVPDVNIIVFLRPTHSRRIFIQQLGRGLRISPETGKQSVIVLDYVTDIRRLADAAAIDAEANSSTNSVFCDLIVGKSMISFQSERTKSFVEQWFADVTDLGDADDSSFLEFPPL